MKLTKREDFELSFLCEKLAHRLVEDVNSVPADDPDFVRASELLSRRWSHGSETAEPRSFIGLSPRLNKEKLS